MSLPGRWAPAETLTLLQAEGHAWSSEPWPLPTYLEKPHIFVGETVLPAGERGQETPVGAAPTLSTAPSVLLSPQHSDGRERLQDDRPGTLLALTCSQTRWLY